MRMRQRVLGRGEAAFRLVVVVNIVVVVPGTVAVEQPLRTESSARAVDGSGIKGEEGSAEP